MTTDNEQPIPKEENTYLIDVNSLVELARLTRQDRLITHQVQGGFLAELHPSEAQVETILDLACGPGEWTMGLAQSFPTAQVVGVDISRPMIDYAQGQAEARAIRNVAFRHMNISRALDFPDSTFDLVNARFIGGVLLIEHWPPFLSECLRVAKPGALLRLTEAEDSHSTSEAEERLGAAFYQALYRVRRSFSPTGRRLNLLPILRKLLQNAGFQLLRQHASVLDYSAGTPLHKDWCDNMNISLHLLKPFLVSQAKLFSSAEFDALCQQFQEEQATQEYYALTFLLTTLARKPLV